MKRDCRIAIPHEPHDWVEASLTYECKGIEPQPYPGRYIAEDCGRHCGAKSVADGSTMLHIGHCGCPECHAGHAPPNRTIDQSKEVQPSP